MMISGENVMNRKLLATAIAAALMAPVAATADVQITGTVNVSWDYISPDDTLNNPFFGPLPLDNTNYIADGNSNIVFKGSEDLGNGLKAIWQITTFVDFDDGGDTWANGNTFVGLASDYGTLLLGRHDTPYKMSTGRLDLFANTFADYNNIMGRSWPAVRFVGGNPALFFDGIADSNGVTYNNFDLRPDNVIAYVSPDFNGFSVVAAYVVDENNNGVAFDIDPVSGFATNSTDADAWSIAASYSNGPIFVTAAYEQHNNAWALTDFEVPEGDPFVLSSADEDAWKIGGSYTFGNFQVGGMWERISSDAQVVGFPGIEPVTHDNWMLNGSYAMGNFLLKLQYLNAGGFKGDRLLGSVLGSANAESGADMWAVGVDYNFSKRTKIYALYALTANDGSEATGMPLPGYGLGTGVNFNVTPTEPGGNVDGIGIGVQHKF